MPNESAKPLKQEISYLGARLREPSSYAGLATALVFVGFWFHLHIPDGTAAVLTQIGEGLGAVLGGLAFFLPEK